ncbi:MFS transporter [Subtercola endophyticus]|uniref:MFS transporter n=1 Tax=Subtercola endophyticus TaxID=2895559 RepID=UPI001E28CAE3|nr:MFS transporter [Subtercola endophyticus]UFS58791.1 MFS transporter [Subtercola endophyticus]
MIEATGIFEQVMVYTAIPTLMGVFNIDTATISWVITVFLLVGAATAAISGRLGDIYGRKKILIIMMAISAAGSVISVVFGNFEGILIGRALQGTSAALFPLLVGIAREVVPAPRVPVLIAITTGTASIAGSVGALVAGVLLDLGDWRVMFLASGVLALCALAAATGLPRSIVTPFERTRFDIVGAVVLAPAVAAILFAFNSSRSGMTPFAIVLIVIGLALIAFWIVWELRIKNPMFNLRLFKQRALTLVLVTTAFIGLGVFGAGALLNPILMQGKTSMPVGLGLTPTVAGLYGLVTGIIGFILSPIGGKVAAKYGAKITLAIGIIVALIGFAGFLVAVHNLPLAVIATIFTGVGTSLILVGLPNLIVEVVPPQNTGEAIGIVYQVARTLFSAVGTTVVGILLASSVVPGTTAPTYSAWATVLAYIGATALLALVVTLFIRKVKPMDQRGEVIEAIAEVQEEILENRAEAHGPTTTSKVGQ